jgi:hypothetical protein
MEDIGFCPKGSLLRRPRSPSQSSRKCQDWLFVSQYDEFRWIMLECFGVLVSLENKFPGVDARLKFTWDYNFDFFAVASDLGRSRATYHCAYGSKQTTGSEMHARCVECF